VNWAVHARRRAWCRPDGPSTKTVEGKRIAALRAAESRRTAQMAKESAELEEIEYGSWKTRFWR
jgi:hypothetical protein